MFISPNNAFDFAFLDDTYNTQYASDERTAKVFNLFCLLPLISSLGLFALSLYSVTRRTKEISIRKVLGAPWFHLVRLLTSEYFFLILVASCIAIPAAYWGLTQWLQVFAFHIQMKTLHYALPIALTLIIAVGAVGMQTIKVVIKNPSDTLKYE